MSKEKSPAFQFYPRDLLSDLNYQMMNYPERGMYWHLLSLCWLEDSLPGDIGSLARILQVSADAFESAWRLVGKCFVPDPNDGTRIRHLRLDVERQKQQEWRDKSAKGGRRSAHKRKRKQDISDEQGGTTVVGKWYQPNVNQTSTLLSSSSSSSAKETPPKSPSRGTVVYSVDFIEFWEAYPRKTAKAEAWRAWKRLKPENGTREKILASIADHLKTDDWQRDNGQYIPHPATFLNQRRFEDELAPMATPEDYQWLFKLSDSSKRST